MAVADKIRSEHGESSGYANRTGKGEMRESAFRDWLREFLSARLAVSKGEIVDSSGNRSREFDCIIHLPSTAPRVFGRIDRHSVPIEEVLTVIEIKSRLQPRDVEAFSDSLDELGKFKRHYKPTELLRALTGRDDKAFALLASKRKPELSAIDGLLFAYEAASSKAMQLRLDQMHCSPLLRAVHVLQRWMHWQASGEWANVQADEDSFVAFAAVLLTLTTNDQARWTFYQPDVDRYVTEAIRHVGAPLSDRPRARKRRTTRTLPLTKPAPRSGPRS